MSLQYADFNDLIELPAVVNIDYSTQRPGRIFTCPYCQRRFSLTEERVKFEKIEPDTSYVWQETSVKIAYIACQCKVRFILRYINPQGYKHALQRWINERRAPATLNTLT